MGEAGGVTAKGAAATVLEIDTPHGPARANVHPAREPAGALVRELTARFAYCPTAAGAGRRGASQMPPAQISIASSLAIQPRRRRNA